MKKIVLILALVFAANLTAQTQYEKGMNKAFELGSNKKILKLFNFLSELHLPKKTIGYRHIMQLKF